MTATVGEVQRFLAEMTALHGHICLHHDPGRPLDIECEGQPLTSREELNALPANRLVKVCGYISLGVQKESYSLQRVFRDWQNGEKLISSVVLIPQDRKAQFEESVRALGGTILA